MMYSDRRPIGWVVAAAMLSPSAFSPSASRGADLFFQQTNLVSSVMGMAPNTDANLKNPWGISFSSSSPFWVSDQVTGMVTTYNSAGQPQTPVVTIPGTGGPTGQVYNNTGTLQLSNGSNAQFLFATLDGRISGWNNAAGTSAITMVDNSAAAAVYTGLAISGSGATSRLDAANHANGVIDRFDGNFTPLFGIAFTDPTLPAGFTPYNIQNLGGTIYVTYENETSGGGVVNAFTLDGILIRRISANGAGGALDGPWGLALAPASFGQFAGALLVGNEGDGHISAFDPTTGQFLGQLLQQNGQPLANPGLWGLTFGNGGSGGDPNLLYFAAGIQNETQGLFGSIQGVEIPEPTSALAALLFTMLVPHRRSRSLC